MRKHVRARILAHADTELRDRLVRATSSIVLNIAEGAGRWQKRDKNRFHQFARGSTLEAAAIFSLLHIDEAIEEADDATAIELADRISAMLTRLLET